MAILESQLNGRIATLLGRMAPRWNVRGENKGAFQGNQKQPDILITQTGAQPVVIENEYLPANTVEVEARERLGESLYQFAVTTPQIIYSRDPIRHSRESGNPLDHPA